MTGPASVAALPRGRVTTAVVERLGHRPGDALLLPRRSCRFSCSPASGAHPGSGGQLRSPPACRSSALARSEGLILLVLLAVPGRRVGSRVGLATARAGLGVMALVSIIVMGPWVVRNLTTFEEPTLFGSSFGIILAYGNCDATYHGSHLGYWDDACSLKDYSPKLEESVVDKLARQKGLDYIEAHKGRRTRRRRGAGWSPVGGVPADAERAVQRGDRATRPRRVVGHPRELLPAHALRDRRARHHAPSADPDLPDVGDRSLGHDHVRARVSDHPLPRPRSTRSSPCSRRWPS